MSKCTRTGRRRTSKSPQPASSQHSLERLLESPRLARVVPGLAPEALHQMLRSRGLDACTEVVAVATPAQLTSIFDLDLWQSARPGQDESFDTERFGEWVELLADAGGPVTARTVAAMGEQLLVAGLSRYIRVLDPAAILPRIDGEPVDIDVSPHSGPECEVGGYLVRGVTAEAWDAIVALLLALEAERPDLFHAAMHGCRRLSNSLPEVDGLDELLFEPEQLLHDVAGDRAHRRAGQGYCTPADARAFLQMARQRHHSLNGGRSSHPLMAAYLRAVADAMGSEPDVSPRDPRDAIEGVSARTATTARRPLALLDDASARPLRFARLRMLIEFVRDVDESTHFVRSQELAFLANTLMAGCSIQSRSFTPQEASTAAAAVCNLGLELWPARWRGSDAADADLDAGLPDTFLVDHDLVSAFEVGWAGLHEDVCLFVADQLVAALSELRCSDVDIQTELDALVLALARQRQEGTPWRASEALDVLATFDMLAWVSVLGLLGECPVIPAALTATLEARTGKINASEFEFISTISQTRRVREFMARFPDILLR